MLLLKMFTPNKKIMQLLFYIRQNEIRKKIMVHKTDTNTNISKKEFDKKVLTMYSS